MTFQDFILLVNKDFSLISLKYFLRLTLTHLLRAIYEDLFFYYLY